MLAPEKTFFMHFWLMCIDFVIYNNEILNEIVVIPYIFISVN